jgi:hypothetical protein
MAFCSLKYSNVGNEILGQINGDLNQKTSFFPGKSAGLRTNKKKCVPTYASLDLESHAQPKLYSLSSMSLSTLRG